MFLYNLTKVTEREPAVAILSSVMSGLFEKALPNSSNINQFRQYAAAASGGQVAVLPQILPQVTIPKQDALNLDPASLQSEILNQISGPIYDSGLDKASTNLISDPSMRDSFVKNLSFLNFFAKAAHLTAQTMFVLSLFSVAYLLFQVVYFSAGWGRFVSPGIILILASWPGALVGSIFPQIASSFHIAPAVSKSLMLSLSQSYQTTFWVGLLLLLTALVGKMVMRFMPKPPPQADKPGGHKSDQADQS